MHIDQTARSCQHDPPRLSERKRGVSLLTLIDMVSSLTIQFQPFPFIVSKVSVPSGSHRQHSFTNQHLAV